jgi:DNA-binding NarL/FixJ family response regulator
MPSKKITVLLVDDHVMVCEALAASINLPNVHMVCAFDVEQALETCKTAKIDIAVVDARLPPKSGITLIGQLKKLYPAMRFIGITTFEEKPTLLDFAEAGVMGIVLKRRGGTFHLRESIVTVANGETYFSEEVRQILGSYPYAESNRPATKFSDSELRILNGIAQGFVSKEISKITKLMPYTIDSYRKTMMKKTGTKNVAELISYAHKNGLL